MKYLRQIVVFYVAFTTYIAIEVCYRGYSSPLMGLAAGLAILILDSLNDNISWDFDLLLQGCIGSVIITLEELTIGELWKYLNLTPIWDYTNVAFNFDGVICAPFSLIWIVLSIVGILVADAINYYVFEELPVPYYKICGKEVLRFKEKKCKL